MDKWFKPHFLQKDAQKSKSRCKDTHHWSLGNTNQNHDKIPFFTHQNGSNKKDRQWKVLVKIWSNWNPDTLLVRK